MKRWLPIIVVLILFLVPAFLLPKFGPSAVTASVAVSPEVLFVIGGFQVSNTLFTTWIVMVLILLFVYFATRKLSLVPGTAQNLLEMIIELWDGLGHGIAGARSNKFFPIVTTIFIFVFFSNILGLIPGFGPIGIIPVKEGDHPPAGINIFFDMPGWGAHKEAAPAGEHGAPAAEAAHEEVLLAPFFRSPSTDINFTLAIALISVIMTQVFGMQTFGPIKYWFVRFFLFDKIGQFFGSLLKGKPKFGLLAFGFIDVFVGFLELFSEMVKIVSFTFRLFGNIFAGEVVLLIMAFLSSTFIFFGFPFPFYALELFVGFMQAFVFAILTLVFMTIATSKHGAEEHH
ncbi:MAG: F0F1 ATP synthase subunit A [Chloroflexi bacterium]|nr:F0F1 ATP synthase subunit A [Chloroflexota bacterium]